MAQPFFTIGHSTRSIEEFTDLLVPNGVTLLVDVRTVPRSRANPQYNADALPGSLAESGIGYEHIASLGGLRGHRRDVPPDVNGFWENQSFHNYADYALGPEFRAGLEQLVALGSERRCAIMCAESVWWRCHRRIISDYLLARGEDVFHLVSSDVPEPAKITPEARPGPEGTIVYPARQAGLL
ncbi:MAG TPA: DUF488 domain-containing protein [Usitatibacter sp.]|nr:DUF488 domain-containing protein [Usitatibacter sp.]